MEETGFITAEQVERITRLQRRTGVNLFNLAEELGFRLTALDFLTYGQAELLIEALERALGERTGKSSDNLKSLSQLASIKIPEKYTVGLALMLLQMDKEDLKRLDKDFPEGLWEKVLYIMQTRPKSEWKKWGVPDYMMRYEIEDE